MPKAILIDKMCTSSISKGIQKRLKKTLSTALSKVIRFGDKAKDNIHLGKETKSLLFNKQRQKETDVDYGTDMRLSLDTAFIERRQLFDVSLPYGK